jgi:hypothetical protein
MHIYQRIMLYYIKEFKYKTSIIKCVFYLIILFYLLNYIFLIVLLNYYSIHIILIDFSNIIVFI